MFYCSFMTEGIECKLHLGIDIKPLPVGGGRQRRECHSKEIFPPYIKIGSLVSGLEKLDVLTVKCNR